jgi:hypothetical protein
MTEVLKGHVQVCRTEMTNYFYIKTKYFTRERILLLTCIVYPKVSHFHFTICILCCLYSSISFVFDLNLKICYWLEFRESLRIYFPERTIKKL